MVLDGATNVDTSFADDLVATRDGVPLIVVPEPARQTRLAFTGNVYDTDGAPVSIVWGGTTYSSVEAWSAATGQEP